MCVLKMKLNLIISLVISVIIVNVLAAPFLNKLIPSTAAQLPLPTHISDFRNQPRSDSRADKTDSLPVHNNNNNNNIVKLSTVRPKRGVEFYTEILGKVIGTARQQIHRVIRNLDQNSNRNQKLSQIQKLTNTSPPSDEKLMTTTIKSLNNDDEESTEFFELTLDNEDEPNVTFESGTYSNDYKKKYFLKILNAIGLYKYGGGDDSDKSEPMENTENNSQKQRILQSAIEFFQPIVHAWNVLINNFNNMNLSPSSFTDEHNIFKRLSDNNNNNRQLDDVDFTTTTISSLSSQILLPSAVSVIDIKEKIINTLPLFFNETSQMKAKLAFENAFYKYSDLVSKGYYNKTTTTSDIPLGNDSNLNNTMDFIVNFPVERIDDKNNDGVDDDDDDDDDDSNSSSSGSNGVVDGSEDDGVTNDDIENSNPQNIGIFILEILGTIAGLTWGAVNHFQNMNQQN